MMSDDALEQTVIHRGRFVLAMDCGLAEAQLWLLSAAQLGRLGLTA